MQTGIPPFNAKQIEGVEVKWVATGSRTDEALRPLNNVNVDEAKPGVSVGEH